jgi:hypothetical protein
VHPPKPRRAGAQKSLLGFSDQVLDSP